MPHACGCAPLEFGSCKRRVWLRMQEAMPLAPGIRMAYVFVSAGTVNLAALSALRQYNPFFSPAF